MGSSPFHGIFSSFGQEQPGKQSRHALPVSDEPAFELPLAEEEDTFAGGTGQQSVGQIAVDIYEQDGYYIIRAPIAGVRLSDLDIEVDDRVLAIRGTRKLDADVPEDRYYLQECFWGAFSRSITLPFPIDPKKVRATFSKDSILKILIPKEEKVKIVRINEA